MLEIKGVTKIYNKTVALDSISVNIKPFGITGFLGPNGSGKSTLLRILGTVQLPDFGTITFNGIDVLKKRQIIRRQLGFLPQTFDFPKNTTPYYFLQYVANAKGISGINAIKEVERVLATTNLFNNRNNKISDFSHGMKQKLGIAQAIIGKPKILLLDEPTVSLDPVERNNFFKITGEIAQQCLVLFSTHIVDDIQAFCKRVIIINKGRILFNGDFDDIIKKIINKIWITRLSPNEVRDYKPDNHDLYNDWNKGDLYIIRFAESKPYGFERKTPDIKDFFFYVLKLKNK